MRVLVIGGSGLFGKKCCLALLADPDCELVVTYDVQPPDALFHKRIEPYAEKFKYVRGDISDLQQLLAAASANKVDRMVNWAMILSKDPMPWLNMKIGMQGMANFFETARILGIKRLVYASSETVYGEQSDYGDREITEDDRLLPYPGSVYALCKCLAEVFAAQYDELYGIKSTALRPCIGYGHGGKDPIFVRWFSNIVSLPAVGKPVHLECTGDWHFSTILSDEVGEFTHRALRADSSPHSAYNLGGPPVTLKDFAATVKKYLPDADITFGDQPEDCELPWKVNCDRAAQDFGFKIWSLDEAVLKHINEARAEAGMEPIQ
jgi:UDP-glucose 4-epimerase